MYLSLNINTLSQLNEGSSSDFSDRDGFIHVLQLEKEPESFWGVETVKSVQVSQENFDGIGNLDPNSTRSESHYEDWANNLDEMSEVEELEE